MAGGGGERVMLNLAKEFSRRGHRVDLVLARARGPLLNEIPSEVRVVDLQTRTSLTALPGLLARPRDTAKLIRSPSMLYNLPFIFGSIPALSRYLKTERPDAMLSALNFGNLAAIFANRLAGGTTRLTVSEHNPLSVRVDRETQRRMKSLPESVADFYPLAHGIGAVSCGVADDLARTTGLPRGSIQVTYNPAITPELAAQQQQAIDHPWFKKGEPPVILGVGRLQPQKDFSNLIRAFAKLRSHRRARLLILGRGPLRKELQALARSLGVGPEVDLHGFVPNSPAFMRRAALFALSSTWEGFGMVLVEAMGCGCPVVSTDCPNGPAEILAGGRYGPLVPVNDSHALSEAMIQALDKPTSSDLLIARARQYSSNASGDRYLSLMLGESMRDPGDPS